MQSPSQFAPPSHTALPDRDSVSTSPVDNDIAPTRAAARWVRILWSPTTWSLSLLFILALTFSLLRPDAFLLPFNIRTTAIAASSYLVMGVGVTFVLSAGGLDLSVGSVLVLAGVVGTRVMANGANSWGTIAIGLVVTLVTGFVCGLINGVLIARLRIPALVVTLGTSFAATGIAYILTGGQDLRDVPDLMVNDIGYGTILGIPVLLWIPAFVGAIAIWSYSSTRFGLRTQAIGSNEEAVTRAGIRVPRHIITLYALTGLLAGLAGFLNLAQYGTTSLSGHGSDFLYVLLAVILGGTSLAGGVGSMGGTCLAVFIPWVLNDGFIILGVNPYWQFVTLGSIFIAVVYLDRLRRQAREGVRH